MQVEGQPRALEDLSMEIDVLFESERDMKLLSLYNFLNSGLSTSNEKVEWQDDQMPPETFSAIASGAGADWDTNNDIAGLPVVTAQITKLKVGDVLELPSGEHVIVSAISVAGQTIDLYKRGWGGTTAAAQGAAALTIKIIGNAQVDGSDPMDESYYAPTERYNYVQIFEDALAVSGKVMRSKISREAERARQRGIKLKRLISQLNNALLNGSREKLSASNLATFQGIRNTLTTTSNINGALTVAKVYTMLTTMIAAGGSPSAFHGSAVIIARLEQLFSAFVTSGVSEYNAKMTVKKLDILGMSIEIHVDKHMIDTELYLLDYGKIKFGTMDSDEAKGSFASYVITENGKQIQEQIVGYYTCKIMQPAAAGVRGYGCSS